MVFVKETRNGIRQYYSGNIPYTAHLNGQRQPDINHISGLAMLLEATKITGLSDSDPVAAWPDSSGSGNNATQGVGADQPTYQVAVRNGLPIVRFDGSNHWLEDGTGLNLSGGFTLYMVLKQTAAALALIASIFDSTAQSRLQYIIQADGLIACRAEQSNLIWIGRESNIGEVPVTWNIHNAQYDGGLLASSVRLYRNGSQVDTGDDTQGSFTGVPNTTTKAIEIGSQISGTSALFRGDIGEVRLYLRELSAIERGQVDRYLSTEWDVALS